MNERMIVFVGYVFLKFHKPDGSHVSVCQHANVQYNLSMCGFVGDMRICLRIYWSTGTQSSAERFLGK